MIRPAVPEDMPALLRMGRAFHAVSPYGRLGLPLCERTFAENLAGWMDDENGIVLVAEVDGAVVGFAVGLFYPAWINAAITAGQEVLWWVDPEHRNGLGRKMFAELERLLSERADFVVASDTEALRGAAVDKVYRRRGYEPIDRVFAKRV